MITPGLDELLQQYKPTKSQIFGHVDVNSRRSPGKYRTPRNLQKPEINKISQVLGDKKRAPEPIHVRLHKIEL